MIAGVALTPFDAAAILIVLAAGLGYCNYRFLKLPASIGLTVMGAIASLLVVGIARSCPGLLSRGISSVSSPASISTPR
jgi:CPA1 family monovalent cation:H+ antiporter